MGLNIELLNRLDISDISCFQGDFETFKTDNKLDYETFIILALPSNQTNFKEGNFTINFTINNRETKIEVQISKINNKDQDPIFYYVDKVPSIVYFEHEKMTLPPEMYTDNKGEYPYYCAVIHFPFCLAGWFDQNNPNGTKQIDYERAQITGGYKHKSKIEALSVLNKLFSRERYDSKLLVYEDVTLFIELYFSKKRSRPMFQRVNIFTSNDAYKNSIKHFFGSTGERHIRELIKKRNIPNIKTENDLSDYILYVINDLIVHEVENRNWTDAFWNGKRKWKKADGESISIPAEPKSETEIQSTLHVLFRLLLDSLGIQVDREVGVGKGNIDFKFTYATNRENIVNTHLEFKLAHHPRIKHGLTKQLPAYLKAERSTCGIFAIMWFKDEKGKFFKEPADRTKEGMLEFIEKTSKEVSEREGLNIKTAFVDASIKQTASNL